MIPFHDLFIKYIAVKKYKHGIHQSSKFVPRPQALKVLQVLVWFM